MWLSTALFRSQKLDFAKQTHLDGKNYRASCLILPCCCFFVPVTALDWQPQPQENCQTLAEGLDSRAQTIYSQMFLDGTSASTAAVSLVYIALLVCVIDDAFTLWCFLFPNLDGCNVLGRNTAEVCHVFVLSYTRQASSILLAFMSRSCWPVSFYKE